MYQPQKALPQREHTGRFGRRRSYLALNAYALGGEWAYANVQEVAGSLWSGIRGRRRYSSLVFQVRDNYVSLVYVGMGGGRGDVAAAICSRGTVAALTLRIQRDQRTHW